MPLGWIDYSRNERNKVLSVLDLLSENGTLDELGIAPVRDGFSSLFFPGTSTIQTRAKYFFIVPYALKDLELSKETSPSRIADALSEVESDCAKTLIKMHPTENGIIGKTSLAQGSWVKRPPSEIYWSGLKQFRIYTGGNHSISEYIGAMCALKRQKASVVRLGNRNDNAEEGDKDDKNSGEFFKHKFWNIPMYDTDWRKDIDLPLTATEGAFLKMQIENTCKGTLIAYILENEIREIVNIESFLSLENLIYDFPDGLKKDYKLARDFALFTDILQTVFTMVVTDDGNPHAVDTWEENKSSLPKIADDCDIDSIFNRLNLVRSPLLKQFLTKSRDAMRAKDLSALKKLVKDREISIKGVNRAKSSHPGEFDNDKWYGGGTLEYRFNNARIIIKDIFDSIGIC